MAIDELPSPIIKSASKTSAAPKTGPSQPPPPQPRNQFATAVRSVAGLGNVGRAASLGGLFGALAPRGQAAPNIPSGLPTGTNASLAAVAGRGSRLQQVAPGVWAQIPVAPSPTARWDRITMESPGVWSRGPLANISSLREDFLAPVAPGVWAMVNLKQLNAASLATPDVPLVDSGGGGGGGGGGGYGGYGSNASDRYGFEVGLYNWRVGT